MERTFEQQVGRVIVRWLEWLPEWTPKEHRSRARPCRQCLGSPIVRAAGIELNVPHAVQHHLTTLLREVIDANVDEFTERNCPQLSRELQRGEMRKQGTYRPHHGLQPEYFGAPLDPVEPEAAPFLFTLAELTGVPLSSDVETRVTAQPQLTPAEREVLKAQIAESDSFGKRAVGRVCDVVRRYRWEIEQSIRSEIEPKIRPLFDDLDAALDNPDSLF